MPPGLTVELGFCSSLSPWPPSPGDPTLGPHSRMACGVRGSLTGILCLLTRNETAQKTGKHQCSPASGCEDTHVACHGDEDRGSLLGFLLFREVHGKHEAHARWTKPRANKGSRCLYPPLLSSSTSPSPQGHSPVSRGRKGAMGLLLGGFW